MKWIIAPVAIMAICGRLNAVDIVGHRGAAADAPENTITSYKLAWAQHADAIEGDFRYTRDHKIVCLHDATTERTTGQKAKLVDLTLAEVRALDAGSWKDARFKGERIPTLQEVLAVVLKGKRVLLEIKIGPQIIPDIKRQIEASGLDSSQVTIICFNEKVIAAVKKAMPNIKALWLYAFKRENGKWSATADELLATLKKCNADGLDVGFTTESLEVVDENLATKLRQANLELHLWTVDDIDLARRAIRLGAKSITTNRPGWLRAELDKSAPAGGR